MIYLGIIAIIFLGEYLLKNRIEKSRKEGQTQKILGGCILLRKHHNKGFALNKGSENQPLVAAISLGLTVLCTLFFIVGLGKKGNALLHAGLAMMLGGAYSNTYDRLRRKYVVDYFSFAVPIRKIRNIIFNLSDLCIIIGAMMSVFANIENK
jgi:signal peptidase II